MAIVKNKIKLCETSLSDFSIEQIAGVPFYSRYPETERLFKKLVPSVDFNRCFAQPIENKSKRVIEWYYIPGNEMPCRLADLSSFNIEAYEDAISRRNAIVSAISSAIGSAGENERKFLTAVLSGIGNDESNSTTYVQDGQILFGVWGMRAKQGRKIEDVIREDVLDHRVFTIRFNIKGDGGLSFTSIGRKYGHKLTPTDVPQVTPSSGWSFSKWEPDIPQGWIVTSDATFTAICEHLESSAMLENQSNKDDESGNSDDNNNNDSKSNKESLKSDITLESNYNVHFRSGDGGSLKGKTDYTKRKGEKITSVEIPQPIPGEGYVFDSWDHDPINYEVHSDTEFIARFRKKEESGYGGWFWGHNWFGKKGCLHALLNWILLGLGLFLLFLLLWCFVFGKCNFNLCGCNCNDPIPTPIIPKPNDTDSTPQPSPSPLKPCDELQRSGSNTPEGFIFDMGQESGSFLFEYATGGAFSDLIIIYEGENKNGKEIFRYYGTTGGGGWNDRQSETVYFNNSKIFIRIDPDDDSDTYWEIYVNCPK